MSGSSCNSEFVAELSAANPRTGACSGEGSGSGEGVYTCASNEGYPKVRNHGALTPRSLNVKLGRRRKDHKGRVWLA